MNEIARPNPQTKDRPLALVLQGGGALGAFQVGAYEALCGHKLYPSWIAGTSIGAINGAIIAGNLPEKAVEKLEDFWRTVSTPDPAAPPDSIASVRQFYNFWSAQHTMLSGQPGFFGPRLLSPFLAPPGGPAATSFYDTSPLKSTLERLVDFDRINARQVRLSLGAVEVVTGKQIYFDNHKQEIRPEHVMASGALPPGFPPVRVDGMLYWDGGIVSNTPVDALLQTPPESDLLILVVDLWDPRGKEPKTMIEVEARRKNIIYASRAAQQVRTYEHISALRKIIDRLYTKLPPGPEKDALWFEVGALGCPHVVDILHLIYEEASFELPSKDYEFSRSSVARHREQGFCQADRLLVKRGWCAPASPSGEVRIYESERLSPAQEWPSKGIGRAGHRRKASQK